MRALVTGANRGIGMETARQLKARGMDVVLTARDADAGAAAARELGVRFERLDVADEASVRRAAEAAGAIDVLVNNAGILLDDVGVLATDDARVRETLETNLLGAWRTARVFLPGMIERGYGRVVNVSSGAGSLARPWTAAPSYAVSKVALNMLTRLLAQEAGAGDVKVNAVCPGWVRTRMGGASAHRSVEDGAAGVVWAATLGADGPTGGFFRDGKPIAW